MNTRDIPLVSLPSDLRKSLLLSFSTDKALNRICMMTLLEVPEEREQCDKSSRPLQPLTTRACDKPPLPLQPSPHEHVTSHPPTATPHHTSMLQVTLPLQPSPHEHVTSHPPTATPHHTSMLGCFCLLLVHRAIRSPFLLRDTTVK